MAPQTESGKGPAAATLALGYVTGPVRLILRLEGVAVAAASLAVYDQMGFSWLAFAVFILAPDLSMLAYLAGPRAGAIGYNSARTYIAPLALAGLGAFAASPIATAAGIIWLAHVGVDRALGYGLKYPTAFGDTHLGRIGRA